MGALITLATLAATLAALETGYRLSLPLLRRLTK